MPSMEDMDVGGVIDVWMNGPSTRGDEEEGCWSSFSVLPALGQSVAFTDVFPPSEAAVLFSLYLMISWLGVPQRWTQGNLWLEYVRDSSSCLS